MIGIFDDIPEKNISKNFLSRTHIIGIIVKEHILQTMQAQIFQQLYLDPFIRLMMYPKNIFDHNKLKSKNSVCCFL